MLLATLSENQAHKEKAELRYREEIPIRLLDPTIPAAILDILDMLRLILLPLKPERDYCHFHERHSFKASQFHSAETQVQTSPSYSSSWAHGSRAACVSVYMCVYMSLYMSVYMCPCVYVSLFMSLCVYMSLCVPVVCMWEG